MTPSPRVTCPSPAMTTTPLRRTHKTVVERTSLFLLIGTILDYSSANGQTPCWPLATDSTRRGFFPERRANDVPVRSRRRFERKRRRVRCPNSSSELRRSYLFRAAAGTPFRHPVRAFQHRAAYTINRPAGSPVIPKAHPAERPCASAIRQ